MAVTACGLYFQGNVSSQGLLELQACLSEKRGKGLRLAPGLFKGYWGTVGPPTLARLLVNERGSRARSLRARAFFGEKTPRASTDSVNGSTASVGVEGEEVGGSSPGRTSWGNAGREGGVEQDLTLLLHASARQLQEAMEGRESLTQGPWFAQKWLGINRNAWMKSLGYQCAVHSLFRALIEVADRGEGRDRDVHILLLRSLMRLCVPLEDSIRAALLLRDPTAEDWFWNEPHQQTVASMLASLEADALYIPVTATGWSQQPAPPGPLRDETLLRLSLHVMGAVSKLGPSALSLPHFTNALVDEVRRTLSLLATHMSMERLSVHATAVGLRREFLCHFASRAAGRVRVVTDGSTRSSSASLAYQDARAERAFWVRTIQQQLLTALVREGVRVEALPGESPMALEEDLAVFGFFAFLGRSTRMFLGGKGAAKISNEPVASLLRYLEGGSVLFYPELTNLPVYQLFVEVVCEEMSWLPLYPGVPGPSEDGGHGAHGKATPILSPAERELALKTAVNTCAFWMEEFVTHGVGLQLDRPTSRVQKFLTMSKRRLSDCKDLMALSEEGRLAGADSASDAALTSLEEEEARRIQGALRGQRDAERDGGGGHDSIELETEKEGLQQMEFQLMGFEKELKSVESAVQKLDSLLATYEAALPKDPASSSSPSSSSSSSSSSSARDVRLAGAREEIENIRRLKAEAEALEAALKAKAAVRQQQLLQEEADAEEERRKQRMQRTRIQDQETASSSGGGRNNSNNNTDNNFGAVIGGAANFVRAFARWPLLGKTKDDVSNSNNNNNNMRDGYSSVSVSTQRGQEGISYVSADVVGGTSHKDVRAFQNAAAAAMEEAAALDALDMEAQRFRTLRGELDELELRLRQGQIEATQKMRASATEAEAAPSGMGGYGMVLNQSIEKFQESAADAWRGTTLLGTDVSAAMVLLKRSVEGQELTEREKKILKRTLIDLASVIPIGILMILPLTAVGHAAILAFIQKHLPGLIPSAFTADRLDVARSLERVQGMAYEAKQEEVLTKKEEEADEEEGKSSLISSSRSSR